MIVAVCPKCGADLEALIYTTYPPIRAYRCRKCGWSQEERENITRVPIATAERKSLTNYDRIRSMSDEELAELLSVGCPYRECGKSLEELDSATCCMDCWLDWLRQEVDHVD